MTLTADAEALDAVTLRLADLALALDAARARLEAHTARHASTPRIAWQQHSDQLLAELHELRTAAVAEAIRGNLVRDRIRATLAATLAAPCPDCRGPAPSIVGGVRAGAAAPCPACGREG